jgi:purine-cytosine permease-like protein
MFVGGKIMLKKRSYYVILLIVGIGLIGIALLLRMYPNIPKSVGGVCIGVGGGLFGMSISNLYMKRLEDKKPDIRKQKEIELSDERNTIIRNKAKAKAGDITQWFIMGIAYVTILINASMWVTLVVIGVFSLKCTLEAYFMNKYQKEM